PIEFQLELPGNGDDGRVHLFANFTGRRYSKSRLAIFINDSEGNLDARPSFGGVALKSDRGKSQPQRLTRHANRGRGESRIGVRENGWLDDAEGLLDHF